MSELSDYEVGWLEASIDGEGNLCLAKVTCDHVLRGFVYRPNVMVTNNNREFLEVVRDVCGGGSITHYRLGGNRKDGYKYSMPIYIQKVILPQLELIIKEEQRQLILESFEYIPSRGRRLTSFNNDNLDRIYLRMKELNKRGVS